MGNEGVYYKIAGRRYYVHDQVMILASKVNSDALLRP